MLAGAGAGGIANDYGPTRPHRAMIHVPFGCSRDNADKTLQIWLSFSQWSEPQSNYSSGTVITPSLSMHLITGVLTKK